ncbi:V-type proton ATPase subunit D-like [Musca vetustissima]|uniref:V-type proton ATPase subunit D-like n=1 Tax=Musca vetustissima TaxID=27455 RepID=UPI002AB7523D|nr:V-type proton ATPase subunit D-like [Musca vetustissima]
MSGRDVLPIFPSRANFVLMKQRIVGATTGLSLLKRKRDALELHLRQILSELKKNQEQVRDIMQEARFSMAKAKFLATDFKSVTVEQPDSANAFLHLKNNKIVGMNVPSFELVLLPFQSLPLTGLGAGGQQVDVVREKFQEALRILVALASLEYNAKIISEAVKLNNRRVNGLEYVVLPRYHNTLNYIRDELDEFEREDFYRLKRSQAKQNKKKTQFSAEMNKRSESKSELTPLDIDLADWTTKQPDIKQMGLTVDPTVPVTRKTFVSLRGNTVVLMPEEEMKPVIIKSRHQKPTPASKSSTKLPDSKNVVTASPSSSEESLQ